MIERMMKILKELSQFIVTPFIKEIYIIHRDDLIYFSIPDAFKT